MSDGPQPVVEALKASPAKRSRFWRPRREIGFLRRIELFCFFLLIPSEMVALAFLWSSNFSDLAKWTLTALLAAHQLLLLHLLREKVIFPLHTLANIIGGFRDEDYSIRARVGDPSDPLGVLATEVNTLAETLREQRLGALEAAALLRAVISELDTAIFTFDSQLRLRLVNRAGERLLAHPSERLLGRTARDLGLGDCLEGPVSRTFEHAFPGLVGRFALRRSQFRERGFPHQLLVLSDLSRTLREEERLAWQRLLRVLGHEINNSLAPIKSISGSLKSLLARSPRPDDWEADLASGLEVVSSRSEALNRFVSAYSQLARLPPPRIQKTDLAKMLARLVTLDTRRPVHLLVEGPVELDADPDQLEQLLINLLRNAVDASCETGGAVHVQCLPTSGQIRVIIDDEGPGLSNPSNLFVPFFTTKLGGTGIGLILCRQIAEAHEGSVLLANRAGTSGCRATLILPAAPAA